LTSYPQKASARLLESAVLVALSTAFVHLTTSESVSSRSLTGSAIMVLVGAGFGIKRFLGKSGSAYSVWIILSALAGGFWFFSLFRFMGFVSWPLDHATDSADYIRLLYFHVVLSVSVLTPVIITGQITAPLNRVSWGNWWNVGSSLISLRIVLWLILFGVWFWALFEVLSVRPRTSGPMMGLIVISTLKATLTGVTEEICYRSMIQSAAIDRLGVPIGIVLQSSLYAAFHLHLGQVFLTQAVFLAGVMALGLVFGIVTRLSGGIGWACTVHTAINLVIEWHNIS
jgi:membrane protease YdiL (CAAX protease family)